MLMAYLCRTLYKGSYYVAHTHVEILSIQHIACILMFSGKHDRVAKSTNIYTNVTGQHTHIQNTVATHKMEVHCGMVQTSYTTTFHSKESLGIQLA